MDGKMKKIFTGLFVLAISALSVSAQVKILTFDKKGNPEQKVNGGEKVSFENAPAVLWKDLAKNTQIKVRKFPTDWSKTSSLLARIYSSKATGQVIYFAPYSENESSQGPDYYKYPVTINWTGWKQVAIPFSQFNAIRTPAGWQKIDQLKIASNWDKTGGIKPDTELYIQSITAGTSMELSALFSSNMVLQRDSEIKIRGKDTPGQTVQAELNNIKGETQADADGNFIIILAPQKAGGPYVLKVSGSTAVELTNVMVGDVWFCGGQSNMGMQVSKTLHAKEEIATADYPNIRLFTVARRMELAPVNGLSGKWDVCTPATVKNFSATAYYFARELRKNIKVPIGLINCSWGGTMAEAWMSLEAISAMPELESKRKEEYAVFKEIEEKSMRWDAMKKQYSMEGKNSSDLPKRPRKPHCVSSVLYNGMVAPTLDFPVCGVIWYQGESNARNAKDYAELFRNLILDWRKTRNAKDMPFYYVQLANYHTRNTEPSESPWSLIREGQRQALELPATAMAVAIDVGDANDIHPKNKQEVGRRLALIAMNKTYGETSLEYSGPVLEKVDFAEDGVMLTFSHCEGGLDAKGGDVRGFALRGARGDWRWADKAEINDNTIKLSSEAIPAPDAVRYGWAINPDCTLYNKSGLPASPFMVEKNK
jgi:sialate O-acetylesterase